MVNSYLSSIKEVINDGIKRTVDHLKKLAYKGKTSGCITVTSNPRESADVVLDLTKKVDIKSLKSLLFLETRVPDTELSKAEKFSKDFNIICWDYSQTIGLRFYSSFLGVLTKTGKSFVTALTEIAQKEGFLITVKKKCIWAVEVSYTLSGEVSREELVEQVKKIGNEENAKATVKRAFKKYGINNDDIDDEGELIFAFFDRYDDVIGRNISYNVSAEFSGANTTINIGAEIGTAITGYETEVELWAKNYKGGDHIQALHTDGDITIIAEETVSKVGEIMTSIDSLMSEISEALNSDEVLQLQEITCEKE